VQWIIHSKARGDAGARRLAMADEETGDSPQTDPLSTATRTTKRNLLVASLVAITFRAFDISADKIVVAILAILSLYNIIPLSWLAALAPSRQ
jgi:hypothetical protein